MRAVRQLLDGWRELVREVNSGPRYRPGLTLAVGAKGPRGVGILFAGGRLVMDLSSLAAACELLSDAVQADELRPLTLGPSGWDDVLAFFSRDELLALRTAVNARLDAPSSVRTGVRTALQDAAIPLRVDAHDRCPECGHPEAFHGENVHPRELADDAALSCDVDGCTCTITPAAWRTAVGR